MKSLSRVIHTMGRLVLAGALLALVQLAGAAQGSATVRSVTGKVEYSTGGAWAPLKSGAVLNSGAVVRTGAQSEAKLDLGANGGNVVIMESSSLGIDKLVYDKTGADTVSETQLDLKVGRIVGDVNKKSAASRFEVKMPTGVAGIRGTKFDLAANGVVKVKNGCVVVVYVDPAGVVSSYEVCGGFKFVPGVGVVPMTRDEMQHQNWDKFTGSDRTPRTLTDDQGRPIIFVAPTLPASPSEPVDQ